MILSLILLGAIVAVGFVLWLFEQKARRRMPQDEPVPTESGECCGMHITCEKDSWLASVSKEIEYYDDEELDRFAGRAADAYTEEETDEFRDILLSMQPHDIAGWARSIQLRGIVLPTAVRDELIMIVSEARKGSSMLANAPIS